MSSWAEQHKIKQTPSIFINDYRLPENYQLNDLEKLLN